MPVDSKHRDYAAAEAAWSRCRDVIEGEDRVKERAEAAEYLPRLGGQDEADYAAYLKRAMFHNATARTVQAVVGAIFRKPLVIEPQPKLEGKDLSRAITDIARDAIRELASVGRFGLLVDVPVGGGTPYMVIYAAESVVNWRTTVVGDQERLTMVVLRETVDEVDPDDPYVAKPEERYRELFLDEGGLYAQRVWRKVAESDGSKTMKWVADPAIVPLALGERMSDIPFVICGSTSVKAAVQKAPLLDLVNVNLSHFRTSADLEHGRHFTALPTPWVAGFQSEKELRIGSGVAWVSDNPQARAGYLEFSGAGLGSLQAALEQKEHLMSVLGARLFEPSRAGVESAEALRIRQSADTASAAGFADVTGLALTKAYQWMLGFVRNAAGSQNAKIEVNKDIVDVKLQPPELAALVSSWQAGGISFDTMLYNLKQGEIIPMERSIEDEKALILADDERFFRGAFSLTPEDKGSKEGKGA